MPLKNYMCTSLNNGSNHYMTVFDPVSHQMMLKAQWDPTLLDNTQNTMVSELQTIYGGTATIDYNVVSFIGASTTGEAIWAIAISAATTGSADFRNYMKVMAYSNTTSRTIASLNQSVTKKAGENFAQPIYLVAYSSERAYFGGYTTGASPNVRIYDASSSGVVLSPCSSAAVTTPGVEAQALVYAGEPYLAPSALSGGNQMGYLLRYTGGTTWTQVATQAGTSATLYPMSQVAALIAGYTATAVTYILGFGSTNESSPKPQGKDANGSFQVTGATLTNLATSTTFDMQTLYDAAIGATATAATDRQAFTYADFPIPAFWQNRVLADEII